MRTCNGFIEEFINIFKNSQKSFVKVLVTGSFVPTQTEMQHGRVCEVELVDFNDSASHSCSGKVELHLTSRKSQLDFGIDIDFTAQLLINSFQAIIAFSFLHDQAKFQQYQNSFANLLIKYHTVNLWTLRPTKMLPKQFPVL